MLNNFISLVFTALTLVALSGCNTVAGLGQDVQHVGGAVRDAAKR